MPGPLPAPLAPCPPPPFRLQAMNEQVGKAALMGAGVLPFAAATMAAAGTGNPTAELCATAAKVVDVSMSAVTTHRGAGTTGAGRLCGGAARGGGERVRGLVCLPPETDDRGGLPTLAAAHPLARLGLGGHPPALADGPCLTCRPPDPLHLRTLFPPLLTPIAPEVVAYTPLPSVLA